MTRSPPFHPNCGKLVQCDECCAYAFADCVETLLRYTEGDDYVMDDWLHELARRAWYKEGDISTIDLAGLVSGFGPDDPDDSRMNALVAKYPLLDIIACDPYNSAGETLLEFESKWRELYGP